MEEVLILCVCCFIVCITVGLGIALFMYKGDDSDASSPTKSQSSSPSGAGALPIPNIGQTKQSPWNITWVNNGDRLKAKGDELELHFVKGKHGGTSGAAFRANPFNILPSETVSLSYEVFFPSTFNFVKGGKLPGVCFGVDPKACATGGEWAPNEGSFRIMWKSNGVGQGYAYQAVKGGSSAALQIQNKGYKDAVKKASDTGHALWSTSTFQFKRGTWNTVSFTLKMNSPGKRDGTLRLTINGVTKTLDDVVFRENATVKFSNVIFVSFFGGGSADWASPVDTYIKFRNIRFSK